LPYWLRTGGYGFYDAQQGITAGLLNAGFEKVGWLQEDCRYYAGGKTCCEVESY
jgi:hypothetical protein